MNFVKVLKLVYVPGKMTGSRDFIITSNEKKLYYNQSINYLISFLTNINSNIGINW